LPNAPQSGALVFFTISYIYSMLALDLTGKNALVGGSTQGIGLAIAQALAAQGAQCTLIARNEEKLRLALDSLAPVSSGIHGYLVADFTQPNQVRDVVAAHLQSQSVHILVNNTGGPAGGPIIDASEDAFVSTFSQHLVCNHLLAQQTVPGMKAAGYGRIINIISTSVRIPLKNLGVSNTIRGAVASWSKTLANELGQFGITVNNILPGATRTERLESIIRNSMQKTGKTREEVENEMLSEIPARKFGAAEDLAALVAFLASPVAGYINGVSIPVDGGRTGTL
jgi:3-oxoacyl-[acyl-carrier protein] reductase